METLLQKVINGDVVNEEIDADGIETLVINLHHFRCTNGNESTIEILDKVPREVYQRVIDRVFACNTDEDMFWHNK